MTVSNEQRQIIRELANNCCEYCRVAQGNRLSKFQIDHIIPIKHGGSDEAENLCLACLKCNGYKKLFGNNNIVVISAGGSVTLPYKYAQFSE